MIVTIRISRTGGEIYTTNTQTEIWGLGRGQTGPLRNSDKTTECTRGSGRVRVREKGTCGSTGIGDVSNTKDHDGVACGGDAGRGLRLELGLGRRSMERRERNVKPKSKSGADVSIQRNNGESGASTSGSADAGP